MNAKLKEEILAATQKEAAIAVARQVLNGTYTMAEFMEFFFDADWQLCQRAAWPLATIVDEDVSVVEPYLPDMLKVLQAPHHDAVARNILRVWERQSFPEEYVGSIYDLCFEYIGDPKQANAIRAYAITICANICKTYPEMATECIPHIEDQVLTGAPSVRSRAAKALKQLRAFKHT